MAVNVLQDLSLVAIWVVGFWVMNRVLIAINFLPKDPTGRYFTLHVICNAIVTVVYFNDVIGAYTTLGHSYEYPCDNSGVIVICALHLFHIIFFQPLAMVDWVHHIVMVVVMLPIAYFLQPGYLLGHGGFFSSGLPGGLDYLMLVLVKLGKMESITEKRINARIQLWIRLPGCVFHSLLSWVAYNESMKPNAFVSENELPDWAIFPATFIVMATFFWNGLYFGGRVLSNLGYREAQLDAERKSTKSAKSD